MIALQSGGACLDLLPEIGGAVARFTVDGIDVLRPAPQGTIDVLETACFTLVPFANRIAGGAFVFEGKQVRLPRNFGDHPHVLHGQGWQNPWRALSQTPDMAVLAYDHPADAWPWDYTARQTFTLASHALRIDLEVSNCGAQVMPVSLGFHPYFERTPKTRLHADVAGVWLSDETCVPTRHAPPSYFLDLAGGAALADAPFIDHCHVGWQGSALAEQPEYGRSLVLTASPRLHFLHCFVPKDAGFFCIEPMSAMPDAFHHPQDLSGLHKLEPGQTFTASMMVSVRSAGEALPFSHPA